MPMFQSEWNKTQKPIFGQAEQAKFMGDLNTLANSATNSLTQSLARSGALNSGRAAVGQAMIERDRMGKASNYLAALPMQEEMARRQSASGLLGLGMNWAGRAPIDYQTTSNQSSSSHMLGTENKTTKGMQTQSGPSWWEAGLGGLGQGIASLGGGMFQNYKDTGSVWGR